MNARDQIAEALWASVDDKGIRGRLHREDCDYITDAVIATIRALSPADLAELIEGTVEHRFGMRDGKPTDFARVIGPWRPTP